METAEDMKYINTNKWDFYNKWDFDGMVPPMTPGANAMMALGPPCHVTVGDVAPPAEETVL